MSDETKPKRKANDNPWYWLATLYGEPETDDFDLQSRNRVAWNRCMASRIGEKRREELIKAGKHTSEELTPFSPEEEQGIDTYFGARIQAQPGDVKIEDLLREKKIDFSHVEFDSYFFAERLVFPVIDFASATFSEFANFKDAIFIRDANFAGATFSAWGNFVGATFSEFANFRDVIFIRGADFAGTTFSAWGDFASATFSEFANFKDAIFSMVADFENAFFSPEVDFERTIFLAWPTSRVQFSRLEFRLLMRR